VIKNRTRLMKLITIMLHPSTPENEAVNAFLAVRRINPSMDELSACLIENLQKSAPKRAIRQAPSPPEDIEEWMRQRMAEALRPQPRRGTHFSDKFRARFWGDI